MTANRVALRRLPAARAHGRRANLVKGEKPYTCIPAREWSDTRTFIRCLKTIEVV